jgi:hypothetical protein
MPIKTDEYASIIDSQGDLTSRWRTSPKTMFISLTGRAPDLWGVRVLIRGVLTARISKISPSGKVTTVASGFPSVTVGPKGVNGTIGVADVVSLDGDLYALVGGGGCRLMP